jgi:hypothetical protein
MLKRGNSYYEIWVVLGVPYSIYNDIVWRLDKRRDIRKSRLHGKPWILDEYGNCEVIRMLNNPSNGTIATMDRKFRS